MQAADDYQQQKIQNKSQSIGNLITATNDVDTFQDVIKTIKQYDWKRSKKVMHGGHTSASAITQSAFLE